MGSGRSLYGDQPIAIVGMSGTYPGGRDLDAFWDLLRAGRSGVEAVTDDDLAAAHIPASLYRDPHYVRACSPIADHDCLDAAFFGISPAEARMTDPQHRQFLLHCYLALEQSGYVAERGDLSIGVFGGIGVPSYMIELAMRGVERTAATAIMPFVVGTDKDYVATMVAYRLDLHGPAMTVQTACSTSLVAVHVAVQSLLSQECDLALAGGASVRVPHRAGYMFQDGGIMSRDGICRPFEESATGTIFGSGAGVVALRRLDDALAAGDPIRAVILGKRGEQRRRPQSRIRRAERLRTGGGDLRGARRRRPRSGPDRLHRGARHGDTDRRCHRGDRPVAGFLLAATTERALLRRIGEEQYRPRGSGRGRRGAQQGRDGAGTQLAAAEPVRRTPDRRDRRRRDRGRPRRASVAAARCAAPRWRELVRRRRDQCARHRGVPSGAACGREEHALERRPI